MTLAQYHNFTNSNSRALASVTPTESSLLSFHTITTQDSSNVAFQLGERLGNFLGTCNQYGEPTPLSYPLDRFINFIYTRAKDLKKYIFNLDPNVAQEKKCDLVQINEKKNEIREMLSRRITTVLDQMQPLFLKFNRRIQEELGIAEEKRKPLLLLIGESHYSLHSALMEAYILILLNQLNNFTFYHVFSETFEQDWYDKSEEIPSPNLIVEKLLAKFDKVKIPIDLGTCAINSGALACQYIDYEQLMQNKTIDLNTVISVAGMKKRNQIMANVMQFLESHSVAIVGQRHLYGLIQETNLQDFYHILPIALCPDAPTFLHEPRFIEESSECEQKYLDACFAFPKDEKVFAFPDQLKLGEFFDYPYPYDTLIDKVAEKAKMTI